MRRVDFHRIRRQCGYSIIELLVAMLLSVILGAAVILVFVNNSYSFNLDESIARMQDSAGHALREVAYDVSMAGHYANLHVPTSVTADATLTIGTDCGPASSTNWMYQATVAATNTSLSIMAYDNTNTATVAAAHACFGAGEILPTSGTVWSTMPR